MTPGPISNDTGPGVAPPNAPRTTGVSGERESGDSTGLAPGPSPAAGQPPTASSDRRRRVVTAMNQYIGVLGVLVLLVVVLTFTQKQFFTIENFINIAETNAVLLVVATGLTFVLLVGAIDLSVGGIIALTSMALWWLTSQDVNTVLACFLVVSLGFLLGFGVNGLLIGGVGMSFLVVTIGTASLLRGLAAVWSGGQSKSLYTNSYLASLGSGRVLGFPWVVWIGAVVFLVSMVVIRYTGFGRMLYAVGGNPEAARIAGINTSFVRVAVFGISGGLAAIAGLLGTARITTASPDAQTGIELTAAAAVLLGGTSFMGGRGSLLGTWFGVAFYGVLSNGLTLQGISPYFAGVVSGTVLILAVGIDRVRNGRSTP